MLLVKYPAKGDQYSGQVVPQVLINIVAIRMICIMNSSEFILNLLNFNQGIYLPLQRQKSKRPANLWEAARKR